MNRMMKQTASRKVRRRKTQPHVGEPNKHYVRSEDAGKGRVRFLHATKGWRYSSLDVPTTNLTVELLNRLDRVERILAAHSDEKLIAYITVLCWIAGGAWAAITPQDVAWMLVQMRRRWWSQRRISRRDATIAVLLWLWQPRAKQEAA